MVVTHASVMLAMVAAAASGVGLHGGYGAEVVEEDVEAVDGTLMQMDGARPGTYVPACARPAVSCRV